MGRLTLCALLLGAALAVNAQFVQRNGPQFTLNGQNYNFGGANAYYLITKPKPMVDDLFDRANNMGVPVIRTWAFNVIGNPQGGSSWPPNVNKDLSVYFHYWDVNSKQSQFNDGPNGLEHLDYIVKKAKDTGIKVILSLTNNWGAFGGAEQMNLWYGLTYHDDFYTFDKTKMEYKKWVDHLLNHKNKFTGVAYKDEPAIMAWELINEPRCRGCKDTGDCSDCAECKHRNPQCTPDKITAWVQEMVKYVKSIDKNHLVGVGDEGFFFKWRSEWAYDGDDGDHESLVRIPEIDFATTHTYPDAWKRDPNAWTKQWIDDHIFIAHRYQKPFIMEEFGWMVDGGESQAGWTRSEREAIFDRWTKQICSGKGNWMFWMLGARQVNSDSDKLKADGSGVLFPDYDKYTIYYKDQWGQQTPAGKSMQDRVWRTKTRNC